MSTYQCEGFIKEVKIAKDGEVTFKLEPSVPYLFEKKEEDGKVKRCVMFVEGAKKEVSALIFEDDHYFTLAELQEDFGKLESVEGTDMRVALSSPIDASYVDLKGLLILKSNRMKIHIEIKVDAQIERTLIVL